MLYKSLHQKKIFYLKFLLVEFHFLLLTLWEWNMFWRSYGIIQVYILFWSNFHDLDLIFICMTFDLLWPSIMTLFRLIGGCCELLMVNMVNMEESRSLPMMYGISSHHFFYISFLWGILSLDVWNLVPSFFLYMSFFMGGTRPLPMMYGDAPSPFYISFFMGGTRPLPMMYGDAPSPFCFSWATHCYHYMSIYCTFNTCQRCRIICVVQPNLVDPLI